MRLSTYRDVETSPEKLWAVVVDIESWPEVTESVESVQRLSGEGLAVGASFRLKQPRTPALTWSVTQLTDGASFTWEARSPGSVVVASHSVSPGERGARLVLELDQRGWLGAVVGRILAGRYRRFMDMEADGIRGRAESRRDS